MALKKFQKETDKATRNLLKFSAQGVWAERQETAQSDTIDYITQITGISLEEIAMIIDESGYGSMFSPCLFELFAKSQWDNEPDSLLGDFLKRRGWREKPYAKRYLKALDESTIELWEVMDVKPGNWVDIRLQGTNDQPIRVYERSASKQLTRWDCIAARVITIDGSSTFSGSLLHFAHQQLHHIPNIKEKAFQYEINILEECRSEDKTCQWSDDEIKAMAEREVENLSEEIILAAWIYMIYQFTHRSMLTVSNRDGDELLFTEIKYPIKPDSRKTIANLLDGVANLDFNEGSRTWVWLACNVDDVPESGAIILGHFRLKDNSLVVSVNSAERAASAKKLVDDLLGDFVGQPLSVHETVESKIENGSRSLENDRHVSSSDADVVNQFLNEHYKKVLNEPVPALNNKTPRECVHDESDRLILTDWLKGLENRSASSIQMKEYDFRWMWDELGITYPECSE